MLTIKRNFIINDSLTKDDFKNDSLKISFPVSSRYNTINLNSNIFSNITKLKKNDIVCVHCSFENKSSLQIESLELEISDSNSFKFIKGSLTNSTSKQAYTSMSLTSNCFFIKRLDVNEKINLNFFFRVDFNVNDKNFNLKDIYSIMNLSHISFIDDINPINYIMIKQAVLKITDDRLHGKIEIENLGTDDAKKLVYKYIIPKNYKIDPARIKAYLNNIPVNIFHKIINNFIIFKIDNIPYINYYNTSKLLISLYPYDPNSLYINNISLK